MTTVIHTTGSALQAAAEQLLKAGLEEPYREAVYLLGRRLGCASTMVYLRRDEPMPASVAAQFEHDVARRARREPAAYILGEASFFGREFRVGPATLVPRPETELLVESTLRQAGDLPEARVLDIGTGSGCIAVSLAAERPGWRITALDDSEPALALARENAERHAVSTRIAFLRSNLYEELRPAKGGDFDIIVSNPPYVATPAFSTLAPELEFEPRTALDGGADGLVIVRPLIAGAPACLRPGGRLLVEIGYDQGERVCALMRQAGFGTVNVEKDYSGHDRVVSGVMNGSI